MRAEGVVAAADAKERGDLSTTRLPGFSTVFGRHVAGVNAQARPALGLAQPHSVLPPRLPPWTYGAGGDTAAAMSPTPARPDAFEPRGYLALYPTAGLAPTSIQPLSAWVLTVWAYDASITPQERQERLLVAAMLGGEAYRVDPRSPLPLPAAGDINLEGFDHLTVLPDGIEVHGTLNLNRCQRLLQLPKHLQVGGRLLVNGCPLLGPVSGCLLVGDHLEMDDCPNVSHLSGSIRVGGSLFARRCLNLVSIGAEVHITGHAIFKGCWSLRHIETGAWFGGDLNLNDCTNVRVLPEHLYVGRALRMRGCVALESVPNQFYVGQDIDLTNCRSVRWLPDSVLSLAHPRPVGHLRQVRLAGTSLAYEACLRLSALQPLGMLFVFDDAPIYYNDRPFLTLSDAITYFTHVIAEAGMQQGAAATPPDTLPQSLHLAPLLTFLARLLGTADFQNPNTRPFVARRSLQLIDGLGVQDGVHQACNILIEDSLTHCLDNVQLLLSRLELVLLIDRAEHTDVPTDALRDLGLRMMRASVLDAHIAQRNRLTAPTDEVEMYLAYHIALAPLLDLPFAASGMYYGFFSCVTQTEVDVAAQYVHEQTCDPAHIAAFFDSWEPWRRHVRRKKAQRLQWHSIAVAPDVIPRDDDLICPITQTCYAELAQPIYWRLGQNLQVCDYDSFMTWWAEHGTDPWLSQPIATSALFRLPPPLPKPRLWQANASNGHARA